MIQFGARLAVARKALGMNQTELGRLLGTGRPTISRYERGDAVPTADFLATIGSLLNTVGLSLDWLLYGSAQEDDAVEPIRLKGFGSLTGLRFTGGGVSEVLMGNGELKRLLDACRDVEMDQKHPNKEVLEAIQKVNAHFYEHYDLEFLADVPIAVHGVKLTPVWPAPNDADNGSNWSVSRGYVADELNRGKDGAANVSDVQSEDALNSKPAAPAAGERKTTQTFHGSVGQVGGGDINNNFGDKDR